MKKTPEQIKKQLDEYVIGHEKAKNYISKISKNKNDYYIKKK
jgi:ATP-dependent protease Clp ATPase subunit